MFFKHFKSLFSLHFPSLFITNRGKFFYIFLLFNSHLRSLLIFEPLQELFIFHFLLFDSIVSTFCRLRLSIISWAYRCYKCVSLNFELSLSCLLYLAVHVRFLRGTHEESVIRVSLGPADGIKVEVAGSHVADCGVSPNLAA